MRFSCVVTPGESGVLDVEQRFSKGDLWPKNLKNKLSLSSKVKLLKLSLISLPSDWLMGLVTLAEHTSAPAITELN